MQDDFDTAYIKRETNPRRRVLIVLGVVAFHVAVISIYLGVTRKVLQPNMLIPVTIISDGTKLP